jgi:hypothetical protein
VEKQAVKIVKSQFDSELRLEKVAINPFVLSLTVDGLELDDPRGEPLSRIERIFVNFQLSSPFRWAWTFDEFRLDGPEFYVSRDSENILNLSRLIADRPESPVEDEATEEKEDLPRLVIHHFEINRCAAHWRDEVPAEPVEYDLGPITVSVLDLNTLPQRPGEQSVVITTETGGTLSWTGTLQFNPLEIAGQAMIVSSDFGLLSDYIRNEAGFDIAEGNVDIGLRYSVSKLPDGTIAATVEDFNLLLEDMLVRTFPPGLSPKVTEERELLTLPALKIAGGRFEWPPQVVAVDSFDIDGAGVTLYRDEAGMLEIMYATPEEKGEEEAQAKPDAGATEEAPAAPWRITLNRFGVNDLSVRLEDHAVQPVARTGVDGVNVEITGITNEPGAEFPTLISLRLGKGGTISLDGSMVVLPKPVLDFRLDLDGAALAGAQPYVRHLADLRIDSGALNLEGRLRSSPEEPVRLEANGEIVDLLITETDEGTRIGSWDRLAVDTLVFSAAGKSLEISEVRIEKPYGDVLITEERQVNLGRIKKVENAETAHPEETVEVGGGSNAAEGETGLPIAVTVGRVVISEASADFEDRSLPLPFSAEIADLNGELSTISTQSAEPSKVSLEGKVDKAGLVRVSGSVTPLEPLKNTDLKVVFKNVEMPKYSAYSVPFAGRKIASGRLDLDLGYKLTEKQMVGDNKIVLREFKLGEKVEHPDARDLPLDIVVALLKDPSGKIDVDLPVSGDVGDPQFDIGAVIVKALGNLIVKIATSPFALVGKLVGVEPSDLESVSFPPGRADLTPPEAETAAKLAEALALRPVLVLAVAGVYAPEADGQALREARLDAAVEERIGSMGAGKSDQAMYAEQRRKALEELFLEHSSKGDARSLAELRQKYTRAPNAAKGDEKGSAGYDTLAYTADLQRRLVEIQPLNESDLTQLAARRAANLQAAVVAGDTGVKERVRVTGTREVKVEGDVVPMKVELTAGGG